MSHDQANEGFARAVARGDAGFRPVPERRVTQPPPPPPRTSMDDKKKDARLSIQAQRDRCRADARGLADAIDRFLAASGWDGGEGAAGDLARTLAAYRQRVREGQSV